LRDATEAVVAEAAREVVKGIGKLPIVGRLIPKDSPDDNPSGDAQGSESTTNAKGQDGPDPGS
jgi:hypothetical protein